MNARERVLAILNREPVDRIPVDIWYTQEIAQVLKRHFGVDDDLALWRALGVDKIVWVGPAYVGHAEEEAGGQRTQWGTPLQSVVAGEATYVEIGTPPLTGYDTAASLEDYPYWPQPNDFDYDGATELAKSVSGEFSTLGPWVSFFEVYCHMRGLEQSLLDLVTAAELVNTALDRIEMCQTEMMRRYFDRAAAYVDLVFVSDDMGGQENLLLSLDMWDRFFKDRLRRWCDLIHSYGLKVFYHSDGAIGALIPRLIECGVDVLNPIQHACAGMDMIELKQRYGDRLIFHGAVDNQFVLSRGSVEQVREETRACLRSLGAGRQGYICCSCHNVQPGTPLENILAMIETAKNDSGDPYA